MKKIGSVELTIISIVWAIFGLYYLLNDDRAAAFDCWQLSGIFFVAMKVAHLDESK